MLVAGVMSSTDVIQVLLVLFFVQKCQAVLDYGGSNMVHHKVLLKKQLNVHGHVKLADDAQAQVESSLIQVQQLVKVNKKPKVFSHNHFAHLRRPPHRQAVTIQDRV